MSRRSGAIDKSIIRRFVRERVPAIKHCYNRALLRDRNLGGVLRTSFTIEPSGRVRDVRVAGVADRRLLQCTDRVLSQIQFPRRHKGIFEIPDIRVSYPFRLRAAP